jgi:hypothetical protein
MAAWKDWVEKHQSAIVAMGGPLRKQALLEIRVLFQVVVS